MTRLTARSSTIFVGTGGKTQVFRSMSEVPPVLRRKLQESTNGVNSATILIADKRGREELAKVMRGHSSRMRRRLPNSVRALERRALERHQSRLLTSLRTWLELLLPVAVGASLWLLIGSRL